jgi:hypothetical protein
MFRVWNGIFIVSEQLGIWVFSMRLRQLYNTEDAYPSAMKCISLEVIRTYLQLQWFMIIWAWPFSSFEEWVFCKCMYIISIKCNESNIAL